MNGVGFAGGPSPVNLTCRRFDKDGNEWQRYDMQGHLVSHNNQGPVLLFDENGRWAGASHGGRIEIDARKEA